MFALAAIPLLAVVGIAIDYGRGIATKGELQSAVDAAVLAAANISKPDANQRKILGAKVFYANYESQQATVQFKVTAESVTGYAKQKQKNMFGHFFGMVSSDVGANATAGWPITTNIEIALVLDYSGSMKSNGKYIAMRDAAISCCQQSNGCQPRR